jgi:hypothetical protein
MSDKVFPIISNIDEAMSYVNETIPKLSLKEAVQELERFYRIYEGEMGEAHALAIKINALEIYTQIGIGVKNV